MTSVKYLNSGVNINVINFEKVGGDDNFVCYVNKKEKSENDKDIELTSVELKADFGASNVGLPNVPKVRENVYRYYNLEFMNDGYPGKKTVNGVVAHPIYGSYLIQDYLIQYENTNNSMYSSAALSIGEATLNNMTLDEEYDALCFYYSEEDRLTYYPGKFISGLTQARYIMPFLDLYHISGDEKFKIASERVVRSLKIPQTKGGVLIQTAFGTVVEEYPHEIPTFVLNGWTTIILEVLRYAKATNNKEAYEFAIDNINTAEKLLHKYDLPDLLTSRYQLTGFIYIKIISKRVQNCSVRDFSTYVMNKKHKYNRESNNRWENFILSKDVEENGRFKNRQAIINGVFSQVDDVFEFDITLACDEPDNIQIYVANGDYDPSLSSMPSKRWILLAEQELRSGENTLNITFEKDFARLLGYPTNFAKQIGGKHYNVYHWLHINNFLHISKYYDSKVFDQFKCRWENYVRHWPELGVLKRGTYCFDNPSPPNSSDSKNRLNRFRSYGAQFISEQKIFAESFQDLECSGNALTKPSSTNRCLIIKDDSTDRYEYCTFYNSQLSPGIYRIELVFDLDEEDSTELLVRTAIDNSIRLDVIASKSGDLIRKSDAIISVEIDKKDGKKFVVRIIFKVDKSYNRVQLILYPAAALNGRLNNSLTGSLKAVKASLCRGSYQ